jgi:phosphotransferase system enzyme I (PtsI)
MCGEMAGDPLYLPILLGLGIDKLSMNPLCILKVKKVLRSLTYHESQEFIKAIDQFRTASEIEDFTRQEMKKRLPEEFEAGER